MALLRINLFISLAPLKKEKRKPVGRKGKKRTSTGQGSGGTGSGVASLTSANNTTSSSNQISPPADTLEVPQSSGEVVTSPSGRKSLRKLNSPIDPEAVVQPEVAPSPDEDVADVLPAVTDQEEEEGPQQPVEESAKPEPAAAAEEEMKIIPRLVDSAGQASAQRSRDSKLNPSSWTAEDVGQFLDINECGTLVEAFTSKVRVPWMVCSESCGFNRLVFSFSRESMATSFWR